MSPKAILTRLDERLSLLTGGPADAPARQQTLRATIDWSYELLEPEQRRLFAALSVFPGGARLDEAVEAVYAGDLESLDSLVRQCLAVVSDDPDGEPRFSMLETIREYAADSLEASGDAEQVLRARSDYIFSSSSRRISAGPISSNGSSGCTPSRTTSELRSPGRSSRPFRSRRRPGGDVDYWWARGHFREGRELLDESSPTRTSRPSSTRSRLYGDAMSRYATSAKEQEGHRICREVVPLFETLGDRKWLADGLVTLGSFEALLDFTAGKALIDRAIAIAREDRNDAALGRALGNLGWLERDRRSPERMPSARWRRPSTPITRIGNVSGIALG